MKDRILLLASSLALVVVINKFMMGENAKFAMMVMMPMLGAIGLVYALLKSGRPAEPAAVKSEPMQKT
jgi:hypothetical protein